MRGDTLKKPTRKLNPDMTYERVRVELARWFYEDGRGDSYSIG